MRRALRVADLVAICPWSKGIRTVGELRDVKPHEHFSITAVLPCTDENRKRLFHLASAAGETCYAWPGEVRLANGTAERARVATEARVAKMVSDKAKREAARRRPKARRNP